MAEDVTKNSGWKRKLAAALLGSITALSGIVVDTIGSWREGIERDRAELIRRVERLELLLLGRSAAPDKTEPQ